MSVQTPIVLFQEMLLPPPKKHISLKINLLYPHLLITPENNGLNFSGNMGNYPEVLLQ